MDSDGVTPMMIARRDISMFRPGAGDLRTHGERIGGRTAALLALEKDGTTGYGNCLRTAIKYFFDGKIEAWVARFTSTQNTTGK